MRYMATAFSRLLQGDCQVRIGGGRVATFEILGTNMRIQDTILHGESEGNTFYDIMEASCTESEIVYPQKPTRLRSGPNHDALDVLARLLASSQRPLAIVGSGALWSSAETELQAFAERTQIPLLLTTGALAMPFPPRVAFGLGSMGAGRPSLEAIAEADLILLLGTRVNFLLGFVGLSLEQLLGAAFRPLAWSMGADWNEADTLGRLLGEKLVLNMGPSHPATHGVLRLILELDGELITKAEPDVGFLHRGDEKDPGPDQFLILDDWGYDYEGRIFGAPYLCLGDRDAAAADLRGRGYDVALFDAAAEPGGMLRSGIPEYRLPRELIKLEVNAILSLGVELRVGQRIGRDFRLRDLKREGFKAVFLAIGDLAHRPAQNFAGPCFR